MRRRHSLAVVPVRLTVLQVLPALDRGGVERGTLEVARELVLRGHRAIVASAGGALLPALLAAGAEHAAMPIGRKHPATLRHILSLRRLILRERPDILHARSRLPAWVARAALATLPAAKRPHFVTTFHGLYSVSRYSAVMASGEAVIAVSGAARDYILEHFPGVSPSRVRVIPRGVDPGEFPHGYRPPREWLARFFSEFPQARGKLLLTLAGRVTRLKGHSAFIALLSRLTAMGLPVHGLVAGGAARGGYMAELQAEAKRLGVANLSWLGPRSDMRDIYAVSDLVLSLSRTPESFGRTVAEALALGRPALGFDHGGVGEVLAAAYPEGRVAPGDMETLAAKARDFLLSPPPVPAPFPFALSAMLAATLALYEELCHTPRA